MIFKESQKGKEANFTKKWKRWLAVFLAAVLALTAAGCGGNGQGPAETTETVPATTENAWPGYSGTSKGYTYYYADGRDREWEEDLLYLADLYLDTHPTLVDEACRVQFLDGSVEYREGIYDPTVREAFLEAVNRLIPRLKDLSRAEIVMELQALLALLGDAHAYFTLEPMTFFPLMLEELSNGEELALYLVGTTEEYAHLRYGKLLAVNGVPLEDVVEKLGDYASWENEYCLWRNCTSWFSQGLMLLPEALQAIGILEKGERQARFTFLLEDGTQQEAEIQAIDYSIGTWLDIAEQSPLYNQALMYRYGDHFWYTILKKDTLYIRINEFQYEYDYTYLNFGNELLAECKADPALQTLVVDLRNNPGGYQGTGFDQLFSVIQRLDMERVYVLVDSGSYSNAIITASAIRQQVENAQLVGAPAGQPPNFFASVESYEMPNSGYGFALDYAWWETWPGYEYDALMPDIEIYQTLEDYKAGVDTVLEAVLVMED